MKKQLMLVLTLLVLLLAACGNEKNPNEKENSARVDDTVTQEKKEQRVIATTVASAEIMAKLDYPLVGIPTTSKELPKQYKDVVEVGSPMGPDLEIMRTLKPDLVLSTSTLQTDLEDGLTAAKLKTNFLDFRSMASMEKEIKTLGEQLNRQSEAEQLTQSINQKVAKAQTKVKQDKKPKVLILMGIPGSYLVVTEKAYIGDLVRLAGGENVITGQEQEYLASNTEFLQQANPDIILRAAHGMPKEVVEMFDEEFKTNDNWKHFNAVKNNRVYDLDEKLFGMTASLNAPTALTKLVELFYEQ